MGICASTNQPDDQLTHIITPSTNKAISSENTNISSNQSLSSSPPSIHRYTLNTNSKNPNLKTLTIELPPSTDPILFPLIFNPNSGTNISISGSWYSPHVSLFKSPSKPQPYSSQFTLRLTNNPPFTVETQPFVLSHKNQGHLIIYPKIYNSSTYYQMTGNLIIQLSGLHFDQIHLEPIESKLTNEEVIVFYLINQVRNNPQKFANEFVNKNESKELYESLINYTPVGSLCEKGLLWKVCNKYIECLEEGRSECIGSHIRNMIGKGKERAQLYFGGNVHYGKQTGFSIVLDMLNDNCLKYTRNRSNILNEEYNQVGICIKNHSAFKFCCVVVFGKDLVD